MADPVGDSVDRILDQWRSVRPDLDISPVGVVGRISRLSRLLDRRLNENFARFDLHDWMYDVLATLRRQGPPFRLTAGQLVAQAMVTSGAITNRIDRLVERGLVERRPGDDRRTVLVELTPAGFDCVEAVVGEHLALERALLAALSSAEQGLLADLLRRLLTSLGDSVD